MSVYNDAKYLPEALDSILNQTFSDFEFVIINDGSTDGSEVILRNYQNRDQRIRLVSRANTGLIAALNEGLTYTRGKYIARMDSDDFAMPERFAKQVAFLDSHPDHVAVGTRVLMIDPTGAPIRLANTLTTHEEIDGANMAGQYGQLSHPAVMFRREAIEKVGVYREEMLYAEDADLFYRFAEIGKLANLPDVLLKYRLHLKSIGHTKTVKQMESAYVALSQAHRRRGLEPPKAPVVQDTKPISVSEIHCKWAWWALNGRNIATARRHAFLGVLRDPFSKYAWKTLLCALRGW